MEKTRRIALIMIVLSFASCFQKSKNNQESSVNDTLVDNHSIVQDAGNDPGRNSLDNSSALTYDRAKSIADSLKQKYDLEKKGLLRLSYEEINEGRTIWVCYFDASFKLKYFERIVRYDENVETSTLEVHNPEGITLWCQIDQQGNNSNITIWLKHHIYQKLFDYGNNNFNYSTKKGEVEKLFILEDQQVAHKLITTDDNTQVQISAKLIEIPKEEFTYDADSVCYKIIVQKGEKGEFDSFWSELRIDSALFVHLFEHK